MRRIVFSSMVLFGVGVIVLLISMGAFSVGTLQSKQHMKFAQVDSMSQFNSILNDKSHSHVVVWFYNFVTSGTAEEMEQSMTPAEYEKMTNLYNKIADVQQYKDKSSRFLAVNVATPEGHKIFSEYSVLGDNTLVELPAILLFLDGKMIDNQMSGAMTEERVEAFIERYFKKK